MSLGTFDLKPKGGTTSEQIQQDFKEKFATMVREDGKEVLVDKSQIANHLDRGFTIKKSVIPKAIKKAVTKKKSK